MLRTIQLNVLVACISIVACQTTVTIETPSGKITGLKHSKVIGTQTYNYNEFRRIPFAKPPVGNLRFQKPVKYGSWNDTLNATYFGASCYQHSPSRFINIFLPNKTLSEDCLILNVYVPTDTSSTGKKAVMIWIHGGSYLTGTGMLYDGAYLASIGQVIIVTINYRLGVFGFMSIGNGTMTGNYGIWDQRMAIEWVHDNIESFGGDVNNVTIFGESAGGFSVALHSIIPQNKGLFHRVIAQSGTAISFASMQYNLTYWSNRLVETLKCKSSQQSVEIDCLKQKSAVEVQQAFHYLDHLPEHDPHIFLTFAPRVDGELFTDLPKTLLNNKSSKAYAFFRSLDMIVGNVDSEGSLLLSPVGKFQKQYGFNIDVGIPRSVLCDHLAPTMALDIYSNNSKVAPAVCKKYGYSMGLYKSMYSVDYYSDLYFYSKTVNTLNIHSDGNPSARSFQYLSKKRTILSPLIPLWFDGPGHTSEIPLLFPFYNFISKKSEDFILSMAMMRYWTNFAKYGYVYYLQVYLNMGMFIIYKFI